MSVTTVPMNVRLRLWATTAGRCEYDGCNEELWLDTLTKAEFNAAYIAHIIADKPKGPRGHPLLSKKLEGADSNLMLLCDRHHRLIDREDVQGHPVERLTSMKIRHESRIRLLTSVGPEKQSHVLLYGANVGDQSSPVSFEKAKRAMVPERYPADLQPIGLSLINSAVVDRDPSFWKTETEHLRKKINLQLRPRLADGSISHLSVFAFAPQALLMLLGYLLSDVPAADVYQLHREPPDWTWQDESDDFGYRVEEPEELQGPPALVLSLSATIADERIKAIEPSATIWRFTVPLPNNDFLKSRAQAKLFRTLARSLMDRIKARHGASTPLLVFPAMPVALAVDFGRILMPKADLPLRVYDQNTARGGFIHALDIGDPLATKPEILDRFSSKAWGSGELLAASGQGNP